MAGDTLKLFGLTRCAVPGVGAGFRVNLHSGNRFIPTSILGSEAFAGMASGLSGASVVLLEGRNASWLYAATTVAAIRAGVEVVAVLYPQGETWVVVHGSGTGVGATLESETFKPLETERLAFPRLKVDREEKRVTLGFPVSSGEVLSPGMLVGLGAALAREVPESFAGRVTWDGRTPVWLFAALAGWLWVNRPRVGIGIFSPADGGEVIVASVEESWLPGMVVPRGSGRAPLVGVIGDPNSGKSVLSWKVYYALGRLRSKVYRQDADIRAPTARWMESDLGRDRREAQKVEWDDERDVPMLLERMSGLRRSGCDLVLIDLPGGNHATDPPQRIPLRRRELFRAMDGFILVQKSDDLARAWRAALVEAGVTSPIIAEVLSRRETDRPVDRAVRDERGCWLPGPLDRATIDAPDEAVSSLAAWLTGYAARWRETVERG